MIFHDADGSWTLQLFAISNIWVENEGGQKSRINSNVSATLECKKKPDITYLTKKSHIIANSCFPAFQWMC